MEYLRRVHAHVPGLDAMWRSLYSLQFHLRPQERKSHAVLGAPKPRADLAAGDSDAKPPPREAEHSLAEQCRKAPGALTCSDIQLQANLFS